jgi:hypothetical protein
MSSDDFDPPDDDVHIHGFAMPIPESLLRSLSASHDRSHMEVDAGQARIYAFLDDMPIEDLLTLRAILQMTEKYPNFIDGMVLTILRAVHHVDPDTGLTKEESLAEAPSKGM